MLIDKGCRKIFIAFLGILLMIMVLISINAGQFSVSFSHVLAFLADKIGFANNDFTQEEASVIWYLRMPRTIVAVMVGGALGISGAVMQGLFSNPLADPGIIGVSSGAALGAVIAIALGISTVSIFAMPVFALAGSVAAIGMALFLAMKNGKIPVMILLLAGIVVSMFLGAVTSGILTFIDEQQLQQYLFWMVGGLDYRRWEHIYMAAGPIVFGIIFMCALARHLNILVLGETEARAVGMNVLRYRLILLGLAALTTASAVCISGTIGFVGLIMPHMTRILIGPDHRYLLPASAVAGAIFLLFCDVLGRVIMPPTEIRVGIMTALIGAPYFLYLLRKLRNENLI